MKLRFVSATVFTALLAGLAHTGGVRAETELERKVLSAPAPHEVITGAPTVVAHFATRVGFIEGTPNNEANLQALHKAVDQCVDFRKQNGGPINVPTEWPQHINGTREDSYSTDRFAITYLQTWAYGAFNPDCSHVSPGNFSHTAMLKSSAGSCRIDLVEKTAKGQCSLDAHRSAKTGYATPPGQNPIKQVAGLRCQSRKDVFDEICAAIDGQMTPAYPLVLIRRFGPGAESKAVNAALDIKVSEGVFVPHLQGGFAVQEIKRK